MGLKNSTIQGMSTLRPLAVNLQTGLSAVYSGEIKQNIYNATLGVANIDGRLSNIIMSFQQRGIDATYPLYAELDVLIAGTSVFTTKPRIYAKAGGGAANSIASGEGVTPGVINQTNNIVQRGDIITYAVTMTRTATPTTEMTNFGIVVDLEPRW